MLAVGIAGIGLGQPLGNGERGAVAFQRRGQVVLIPKNVAGLAHVSIPRTRKVKPWTAGEARQFLESAKRDQDPLCAAYVLILVMGLRKGEVVGLPWSAVNLDRAELDVGWQLQRVGGQLLHRETKTEASEATLPLPGICVTAFRIREKEQAAAKAAAGASWVQSGLVFTTRAGTQSTATPTIQAASRAGCSPRGSWQPSHNWPVTVPP